jgi:NADH-quinone oxidoreductase subunit J
MIVLFVIAANVAVAATLLAVTVRVTLHALLYLAVSLLAVAVVFYTLGAPFVAALEVIIYAGAIVVILMFAVMLLALDDTGDPERPRLRRPRAWLGPFVLVAVLAGEMLYVVTRGAPPAVGQTSISPTEVGATLFGAYAVAAELASMLLLVGLIGVRHLARERERESLERRAGDDADAEAAGRRAGAASAAALGEEPASTDDVAGPAEEGDDAGEGERP